jgi:hypothetical protein
VTTEQLQRAIRKVPFRPFLLIVADGAELHVPHPEFITHAPNTRTATVTRTDGAIETVDLLLITRLVEHPVARPRTSRPRGGKR